jgi:tRNA-binding EMAP/Myf-like protein
VEANRENYNTTNKPSSHRSLQQYIHIVIDIETINQHSMVDVTEYRVGVVVELEELKSGGNKALKLCQVNVGLEDPLPVVTSAPNVRLQSRVVVALCGSTVITEEGGELQLKPTTVGGHVSEGMLCDSKMLGWTGGASGVAVNLPDEFEIGSPPPTTKPRPKGVEDTAEDAGPVAGGLFERKLSECWLNHNDDPLCAGLFER